MSKAYYTQEEVSKIKQARLLEDRGVTHYEGCWDSGPKHYECALLEVKKLRGDMNKDEMLERILHSLVRIEAKQNKPWVDLTVDEATIIWERVVEERDGWELIMQVQQALKEKNGG